MRKLKWYVVLKQFTLKNFIHYSHDLKVSNNCILLRATIETMVELAEFTLEGQGLDTLGIIQLIVINLQNDTKILIPFVLIVLLAKVKEFQKFIEENMLPTMKSCRQFPMNIRKEKTEALVMGVNILLEQVTNKSIKKFKFIPCFVIKRNY